MTDENKTTLGEIKNINTNTNGGRSQHRSPYSSFYGGGSSGSIGENTGASLPIEGNLNITSQGYSYGQAAYSHQQVPVQQIPVQQASVQQTPVKQAPFQSIYYPDQNKAQAQNQQVSYNNNQQQQTPTPPTQTTISAPSPSPSATNELISTTKPFMFFPTVDYVRKTQVAQANYPQNYPQSPPNLQMQHMYGQSTDPTIYQGIVDTTHEVMVMRRRFNRLVTLNNDHLPPEYRYTEKTVELIKNFSFFGLFLSFFIKSGSTLSTGADKSSLMRTGLRYLLGYAAISMSCSIVSFQNSNMAFDKLFKGKSFVTIDKELAAMKENTPILKI